MKIHTLQDFYATMAATRQIRKVNVTQYMNGKTISGADIQALKNLLADLESIEKENNSYILQIDDEKTINVELDYEINELKRDLLFLEKGEKALQTHLDNMHEHFNEQVEQGTAFLKSGKIRNLITDRDGTINNYCGRYRSSIQSLYNAVYLTRYAHKQTENSIILTSAPLQKPGLADVSTTPDQDFIYAASKGREFMHNGKRHQLAIKPEKEAKLKELNRALDEILKRPGYEKFGLIGSGIQHKFGQTTIARQDVSQSVPEDESRQFLTTIRQVVKKVDPKEAFFRIEDTGKDIEIILTVDDDNGDARDFDKGDGVLYLNEALNLNIEKGGNLVCGDTHSDVAMVKKVAEQSKEISVIFVTEDEKLKNEVQKYVSTNQCLFVSVPDILVSILNRMARH